MNAHDQNTMGNEQENSPATANAAGAVSASTVEWVTKNQRRQRNRGARRAPAGSNATTTANRSNSTTKPTTRFDGSTPDLKGHIFSIGENQASTCAKTKDQTVMCATRTHGHLTSKAIDDMECKEFTITEPEEPLPKGPGGRFTCTQEMMHKEKVRRHVAKLQAHQESVQAMCTAIPGQCTDAMKHQLHSPDDFARVDKQSDTIALLNLIKRIAFNHKVGLFPPLAATQALIDPCNIMQTKGMGDTAWMKALENQVTAAESCGVSLTGALPGAMKFLRTEQHPDIPTSKLDKPDCSAIMKAGKNLAMSTPCLHRSNEKHRPIKEKLHNDHLVNSDGHPRTMSEAQKLIVNCKAPPAPPGAAPQPAQRRTNRDDKGSTGVAFAQSGKTQTTTCFNCGETGHHSYENKCKPADVEAFQKAKEEHEKNNNNESANANAQIEAEPPSQPASENAMQALHCADELQFVSSLDSDDCGMACCNVGAEQTTIDCDSVRRRAGVLLKNSGGKIDSMWLLLDSQSTVNVICNAKLLTNTRQINRRMCIHCNAGIASTNWVGDLAGVGTVWHHASGIANIPSLSKAKNAHRVTCDSHDGNMFGMFSTDGSSHRDFTESPQGLCCSVMDESGTVLSMIDTVTGNEAKHSNLDVRRADKARHLQDALNINLPDMLRAIDTNSILNCPITRDDVRTAEAVHGPSLVGLKGKTCRHPEGEVRTDIEPLPVQISAEHKIVHLSADIMHVNSLRFFLTSSQHIFFAMAEMIENGKTATIIKCVKGVIALCTERGFAVRTIKLDNEFRPVETALAEMSITANFVSRGEHVPEIERCIRTIKDRIRGTQQCLPHKKCPSRLTKGLVECNMLMWNALPRPAGVSAVLSPGRIVTGLHVDCARHCRLRVGQCVQTHEETDDDTNHERTVGAIVLRPTGNKQGGCFFLNSKTGRIVARCNWTRLPLPADALDRVHRLAKRTKPGLRFLDRNEDPIPEDDAPARTDDVIEPTGVDPPNDENASRTDETADGTDDDISIDESEADKPTEDALDDDTDTDTQASADDGMPDDNVADDIHLDQPAPPPPNGPCNLRQCKAPTCPHERKRGFVNALNAITCKQVKRTIESITKRTAKKNTTSSRNFVHAMLAMREFHSEKEPIVQMMNERVLTQCGMKQGPKLFGERGLDAVRAELQQFHDRGAIELVSPNGLTKEQRNEALACLMLLKEKRCGKIKGRGCADGRKQRNWISKDDSSSPTATPLALLMSCLVDAKEGRDVAVTDAPGAFPQTNDNSGSTHLRLEGTMVDQPLEIDHDRCAPHAHIDRRGKRAMHAVCRKAICGTLNAAPLFWKKLTEDPESWGFIPSPCDDCVMNKVVSGSQCTVPWHADDLRISHKDKNVVSKTLKQMSDEHGSNDAPISTTRGKAHDCLGMKLDHTPPGCIKVTMIDCANELLAGLSPDPSKGEAATPAADHLLTTNENATKLPDAQREEFHKATAKLLFSAERARPDIQLPVAFLCTRVKAPDVDDWKKLDRTLRCLRMTIGLPLVLAMDASGMLRWRVDAAFAVRNDMKSHSGMTLTMGRGAVTSNSSKQKLTTRSSTEAELTAVDDQMSQIAWTWRFMEAQGWETNDNVLCQDNQSALRLERNGKRSSGKRTRCLDIKCFCVTDRINAKELDVEHCPTDLMLGDHHGEPLQGSKFRTFRNTILGVKELDIPEFNRRAREHIAEKQRRIARENTPSEQSK